MSTHNIKHPFTQNRDISWIRFNERVLALSKDPKVPLLERLKFLSIATSNFDEFFMIRMGSLMDIASIKPDAEDSRTGLKINEQIKIIYDVAGDFYKKYDQSYKVFKQDLALRGVEILDVDALTIEEKKSVKTYFQTILAPILSPQIVDHHHPFPHLESKKEHIGLWLKKDGHDVFGLVPIPQVAPLFVLSSVQKRAVFVKDILMKYVNQIFSMFEVSEKTVFTVTRNADIQLDDSYEDTQDLRIKMKELLKKRKRLSVVRIEVSNKLSTAFETYFKEKFQVSRFQIFKTKAPFHYDFVSQVRDLFDADALKSLTDGVFKPYQRYKNISMMSEVFKRDVFLTYPYDAFDPFLRLIEEASKDKDVMSIKITIYRLARRAKLIEYLTQAAENGKDVTVVIELKARFDEQNNIDFSEILELAGCKVMYGVDKLKIHSKLCVITKQHRGQIKHITQIGTGNFNEVTVKLYTDFALLTAHQGIAEDALKVFQSISLNAYKDTYDHLLVAPKQFKLALLNLIETESQKGNKGYIFLKLNAITDMDIILALVNASQKGVKIDMIVRGICCILPGIRGYTETIRIRSIVGRFLEHSRLYVFGYDYEHMYIGSADFMTRNTERRIEVAAPIYDQHIKMYVASYVDVLMSDDIMSRMINHEGEHKSFHIKDVPLNSQDYMMTYYLDMFPKQKQSLFNKIFRK